MIISDLTRYKTSRAFTSLLFYGVFSMVFFVCLERNFRERFRETFNVPRLWYSWHPTPSICIRWQILPVLWHTYMESFCLSGTHYQRSTAHARCQLAIPARAWT